MGHKVFISFKTEDMSYKEEIQSWDHMDYVDKSLNEPIGSQNDDYILRKIRENYLRDSTVTVALIGTESAENLGTWDQRYVKAELQASLYNGVGNTKNGILGVVLPEMESRVFGGALTCSSCGRTHNVVNVNDSTVIREFSYNYYIPGPVCAWGEDDRYCVLARWDDFKAAPNAWIDVAFDKRSAPISEKTKVRP